MRDDSDFSSWLAARWPDLFRSLVFLGHAPEESASIGLEALARLRPGWDRLRREDDVDLALYREMLDERSRRERPRTRAVAAAPREVGPGLSERAERREEVEAALAELAPDEREAVVLSHVAELSEDQVADLVDRPAPLPDQPRAEDVRFAVEAVPVPAVRSRDVDERLRARRRRGWRRGSIAVALVVAVLFGGTWVTDRVAESGRVTEADNPLPVPWYVDDVLHLPEVTVELEGVEQLVAVRDGVVASDDDGEVWQVGDTGEQERIGETVPDTPLVAEADNGWVAWADPGVGNPQLVVFDTRSGAEVGRRSLVRPGQGDAQPVGKSMPVAIEGERVFYNADGTDFAWDPLVGDVAFAVAGSLVDTAGGARLIRRPDGLVVQPAPFRVGTTIPAEDGRLTRDGRFLFATDASDETVVYRVVDGMPIDRMYSPSDRAVSWGYVDDGSFIFVVLHKLLDKTYQDILQMPSRGDYRIYRCDLSRGPDPCRKLAEVPQAVQDAPIIAR